jgi:hypothetical protein
VVCAERAASSSVLCEALAQLRFPLNSTHTSHSAFWADRVDHARKAVKARMTPSQMNDLGFIPQIYYTSPALLTPSPPCARIPPRGILVSMRFILIAVLLFRLVPAPALLATTAHCGEHGGGAHAEHAEGAHAEHAEGAEGVAHDECPHCPPADCAKHDHCPQPGMLEVATFAGTDTPTAFDFTPSALGTESLASRADPPPVRPPLLPLA